MPRATRHCHLETCPTGARGPLHAAVGTELQSNIGSMVVGLVIMCIIRALVSGCVL